MSDLENMTGAEKEHVLDILAVKWRVLEELGGLTDREAATVLGLVMTHMSEDMHHHFGDFMRFLETRKKPVSIDGVN